MRKNVDYLLELFGEWLGNTPGYVDEDFWDKVKEERLTKCSLG